MYILPSPVPQKLIEQIRRYAHTIIRRGPDVVDRNDLARQRGPRGLNIRGIVPERLLRSIAAHHGRGDAAERYANISNPAAITQNRPCETYLRNRLSLARSHFAVVVRPTLAPARQANTGDKLAGAQDHLFVAGMECMIRDPA